MGIIRNTTEGIYPFQTYQQALYNKISQGGFKTGAMQIISSGRQSGKSIYYNNLCKEIMLPGYPKTSIALKKLMPKYQFSRANWYVADYNWIHQGEVYEWCTQQFGPHPMYPDAWSRWYNKYSEKIHFRDEKDYEWFVLKWQ